MINQLKNQRIYLKSHTACSNIPNIYARSMKHGQNDHRLSVCHLEGPPDTDFQGLLFEVPTTVWCLTEIAAKKAFNIFRSAAVSSTSIKVEHTQIHCRYLSEIVFSYEKKRCADATPL
ncbi:hypothetical protein O3G_MSEX011956 [Manduca sexta]|uniref:Uncharacterized protein n=1 Tax=Manduca sexta TaxID=7130 RepID=A0A921ZMH1_MANSE|nr:hypothetical protein O3G_MSEX011956 [Manduca sexta]